MALLGFERLCQTRSQMQRAFRQVDVFTTAAFRANPVAVVLDGDGLSDDEMQRFATWMNLSESTFVSTPTEPGADYRVRIFTQTTELPFAGHPTLGTCHAWLEHTVARKSASCSSARWAHRDHSDARWPCVQGATPGAIGWGR